METKRFEEILSLGETICIEFKRCGNGVESDVYETVCSFLNRFGGDIFLGVEDNGQVIGVPEKAVSVMIKNFIACVSNPALFTPTTYIEPHILPYKGKSVIHIHVNASAEVHTFKKEIFDRVDDADVHVTSTSQIASMYIRKQNTYTERRIYSYVKMDDLRLDLLPTIRKMAVNTSNGSHPWQEMDDIELLRSAGLYGTDYQTGIQGLNLAAVMLLGKDDVITNVTPAYETDCILRRVNIDRYDDREVVNTNLVDSYYKITAFIQKHLSDEFFLEGDQRVSLRGIIAREMTSNLLIHREFSSAFPAKLVIEKNRLFSENANRASWHGEITPDNFEPNPKNPIIASFFRNIGLADKLGSGVRNMYKYARYYHGGKPQFLEQDIFRIVLDYTDDTLKYTDETVNAPIKCTDAPIKCTDQLEDKIDRQIVEYMQKKPRISFTELTEATGFSRRAIAMHVKSLAERHIIARKGNNKNGYWEVHILMS